MNERMKLIIYGAVAAFFFLAALLVPLAFRDGVKGETPTAVGERVALFADYWEGEHDDIEVESVGSPSKKTQEFCTKRIEALMAECTFDKAAPNMQSEGREYLTVTQQELELHICRVWRQFQGDWRNWIDICFDMDTGEIYYLYLSSECLKNQSEYVMSMPAALDTAYVVERIGANDGFELLDAKWSGEAGEAAEAIYSANGSALKMRISCIYYESTLIDIKIVCS